jgi:hypothetical protein
MRTAFPRHLAVPLALTAALMLACGGVPTSPYDESNKDKKPATKKESLEGKEFNQFFPKDHAKGEWDFVFKAEKKGYAEAVLKKNGKDVATLSITDTVNEPAARDKFKDSTEKINNYPVGKSESTMETAVLVGDRFQVKVRTVPPPTNFSKADREDWMKKFDLDGLAKLAK